MIDPEALASHFAAFLVGAAVGAAGHYFGEKYTDRRREKEEELEARRGFAALAVRMPDLFRALRTDLDQDSANVVREFFVLANPRVTLGGASRAHFRYHTSEIENLREKLDLLENQGFITDIQVTGAPKYRLEELFVDRLRKWKQ